MCLQVFSAMLAASVSQSSTLVKPEISQQLYDGLFFLKIHGPQRMIPPDFGNTLMLSCHHEVHICGC